MPGDRPQKTALLPGVSTAERPLEVGDFFEWKAVATHVRGEVVGITKNDKLAIRVDFDRHHPSPSSWQGEVHHLSRRQGGLRRIQRPGAGEPLAVEYDGSPLRKLLESDEAARRERNPFARRFTRAQQAAVSAHWSAQLRARVDASREAEQSRVRVDVQDID